MDDKSAGMTGKAELALLTTQQMAAADRVAIAAGTPGIVLMERAGRAVADAVLGRAGAGGSVTLLCGPGNNGGDGFVAARLLRERGLTVRVVLPGGVDGFKGDAALALQSWAGPVEPLSGFNAAQSDIVVDAMFGAGLTRPLSGAFADAAAQLVQDAALRLRMGEAARARALTFRWDVLLGQMYDALHSLACPTR